MPTDYNSKTKEELLEEVKTRKSAGRNFDVSAATNKADIVAALQLDDETPAAPINPLAPKPAPLHPNIPQVDEETIPVATDPSSSPTDDKFTDGLFKKKDDGETYALAIAADHPSGRSHFAKNSRHSWNGTKEEFEDQFVKE